VDPPAPKTLERFKITAKDWIDRDGGDNPLLTYEFTAAEAGTVSFVSDQCVRQPETGYAERVLSSRSEVTEVDRVLPAGKWDIIVRVYDQLGAVSIVSSEGVRKWRDPQPGLRSARDCGRVVHVRQVTIGHTSIEIVDRVVEAALAEEVRQRGSAALADADPSSGLNDLGNDLPMSGV